MWDLPECVTSHETEAYINFVLYKADSVGPSSLF